jgi:transmembrane sensor
MIKSNHVNEEVVKEAIAWALKLKSENTNASQIKACQEWRNAHYRNELAWQRIQSLEAEIRQGSANLLNFHPRKILENATQRLQRRRAMKTLSLVFTLGTGAWLARDSSVWQNFTADYTTAVGNQQRIVLADGSHLLLNTDSAVDIRFNEKLRLIIVTRGEVFVDSGHDQQALQHRPLRIQTKHGTFEALGTRFVVRQNKNTSQLSVDEGAVIIQPADSPSTIVAHAGERYTVTNRDYSLDLSNDMDTSAWTDGVIVAKNMRLVDFLREVSRYRQGFLRCDDTVANMRLSGVFQLNDSEKLLAILPQTLPVKLEYRTRWWVTVVAKG